MTELEVAMLARLSDLHGKIADQLDQQPSTINELAARMGLAPGTVGARVSELYALGFLRPCRLRGAPGAPRTRARVWRVGWSPYRALKLAQARTARSKELARQVVRFTELYGALPEPPPPEDPRQTRFGFFD